jgi:hypothetical protein
MNRRDFMKRVAAAAAAMSTTSYFVFGNGVWQPTADVIWNPKIATFADWLWAQPKETQDYILGEDSANYWRHIGHNEFLWTPSGRPLMYQEWLDCGSPRSTRRSTLIVTRHSGMMDGDL